eukprot:3307759-Prymnesium_polylepis.1
MSVALVGPHASMPDDVRLSGRGAGRQRHLPPGPGDGDAHVDVRGSRVAGTPRVAVVGVASPSNSDLSRLQ